MSECMFGVGRGRLPAKVRARIERLIPPGVSLNNPDMPGEGYRYWFAGPNRGEPFDSRMARETFEALDRAGIVLP